MASPRLSLQPACSAAATTPPRAGSPALSSPVTGQKTRTQMLQLIQHAADQASRDASPLIPRSMGVLHSPIASTPSVSPSISPSAMDRIRAAEDRCEALISARSSPMRELSTPPPPSETSSLDQDLDVHAHTPHHHYTQFAEAEEEESGGDDAQLEALIEALLPSLLDSLPAGGKTAAGASNLSHLPREAVRIALSNVLRRMLGEGSVGGSASAGGMERTAEVDGSEGEGRIAGGVIEGYLAQHLRASSLHRSACSAAFPSPLFVSEERQELGYHRTTTYTAYATQHVTERYSEILWSRGLPTHPFLPPARPPTPPGSRLVHTLQAEHQAREHHASGQSAMAHEAAELEWEQDDLPDDQYDDLHDDLHDSEIEDAIMRLEDRRSERWQRSPAASYSALAGGASPFPPRRREDEKLREAGGASASPRLREDEKLCAMLAARHCLGASQMQCVRRIFQLYADPGAALGSSRLPLASWHRMCVDLLRCPDEPSFGLLLPVGLLHSFYSAHAEELGQHMWRSPSPTRALAASSPPPMHTGASISTVRTESRNPTSSPPPMHTGASGGAPGAAPSWQSWQGNRATLRGLAAFLELLCTVAEAALDWQPETRYARGRSASPSRRAEHLSGAGEGRAAAADAAARRQQRRRTAAATSPLRCLLDLVARAALCSGETAAVETAVACRHSESGHPWTLQKPLAARQVARRGAAVEDFEAMLLTCVL